MKIYILLFFILFLVSCAINYNTIPKFDTNDSTNNSLDKDYSILSYKVSNGYRYINEHLLFIYDEKYNSNKLKYKIFSKKGELLLSNVDIPFNIRYGRNYIDLALPKSTYSDWGLLNPLLLEVTNEKNQKLYLKFIYSL